MLKEINAGGTHEQNQLGGVPMGVNPQTGAPVTYEEGETAVPTNTGEYVFSNRFSINPIHAKSLGLPKSMIGKSFSDVSRYINDKFTDRSDKISNSTKKQLLNRLSTAQEEVRAMELAKLQEAMAANSTEVPDMMGGQVPQGFENMGDQMVTDPMSGQQQMAWGGDFMNGVGGLLGAAGATSNTNNANNPGRPMSKESTAWEAGKDVASNFGPWFKLFRGVEQAGKGLGQMVGGDGGGDFATGFLDPMHNKFRDDYSFGEKLAGIDPLAAGMLAIKKNKEKRIIANQEQAYQDSLLMSDQYRAGGYRNLIGDQLPPGYDKPAYQNTFLGGFGSNSLYNMAKSITRLPDSGSELYDSSSEVLPEMIIESGTTSNKPVVQKKQKTTPKTVIDKPNTGLEDLGNSLSRGLRYAPVISNIMQLNSLKKPKMDVPVRDNSVAARRYADEMTPLRQADNVTNSTLNALAGSGMTPAAMRANMVGTMLQRGNLLGDAASKADILNKQVDAQADAIDRETANRNTALFEAAKDNYRKDLASYNSQRSNAIAQIANDLGEIGKESEYKNLAKEAFGYTYDGKYIKDKKGVEMSESDYVAKYGQKALDALKLKNSGQNTIGNMFRNLLKSSKN